MAFVDVAADSDVVKLGAVDVADMPKMTMVFSGWLFGPSEMCYGAASSRSDSHRRFWLER